MFETLHFLSAVSVFNAICSGPVLHLIDHFLFVKSKAVNHIKILSHFERLSLFLMTYSSNSPDVCTITVPPLRAFKFMNSSSISATYADNNGTSISLKGESGLLRPSNNNTVT